MERRGDGDFEESRLVHRVVLVEQRPQIGRERSVVC